MPKRPALVALLVLTVVLAAWGVQERAEDATAARLVFHDDFSGRRLDRSHWSTCYWWRRSGCTITSNRELEAYRAGQVRVRDGKLTLTAERRPTPGQGGRIYPYRSGMISSGPPAGSARSKFSFRYGKAEIRARVPAGRGLWSAFWLLPASRASVPEIDVVEILGHRPATARLHLHYRGRHGSERAPGKTVNDARLAAGWHTFSIDWRPRKLIWSIDGIRRWSVRGRAVPSTRMYLLANLAVGGDSPGAPDASTRFPSRLGIDYIKVWR
jgi:beta-glucanase (GH16 family)